MNKKYGFVFLGLGMILIMFFGLYNYTDIFINKNTSNINSDEFTYDYIKSHNTTIKTKVTFPVYNDLVISHINSDDYNKSYKSNNGLSLDARIYYSNDIIDNYSTEEFNSFKTIYNEYRTEKISIKCEKTCERYQAYQQDNSIFVDELNVFIKLTSNEVFELKYNLEGKELSNELIDMVVNNIKLSNDATYKIGKLEGNKLNIDFENVNNKLVNLSLDSNIYEEIINQNNSMHFTTIKNKNTNTTVSLIIKFKESNSTFDDEINRMYNYQGEKIGSETETIDNKTFYKYNFSRWFVYAYYIDSNTVLLIETKGEQIDIDDFKNITIKDV